MPIYSSALSRRDLFRRRIRRRRRRGLGRLAAALASLSVLAAAFAERLGA